MRTALLIIVFLCTASFIYGQNSKWEFGLEGGPNESIVYGSYTPAFNGPSFNHYFGLTAQYNINDIFSIKSGIANEVKGYIQTFPYATPSAPMPYSYYTDRNGLGYVIIPILAKASFGNKTRFFVNAGPYFGYLVGSPAKFYIVDSTGNLHSSSGNARDLYKVGDIGATAGFGAEMPITDKLIINLEARFNMGFINIDETSFYTFENESADLLLGLRYRM